MTHAITIGLIKAPEYVLNPGVFMTLKVGAFCSAACNLKGQLVKIIDQEGSTIKEFRLVTLHGAIYESDQVVIKAPVIPGVYFWTVVFPQQERDGLCHEEAGIPFSFTVQAQHGTSMSVWDVASPLVISTRFKAKAGVRCSADCNLAGRVVAVYDQHGSKEATAKLSSTPWPGTVALYWTELDLKAPEQEGSYVWQAEFPAADVHSGSGASFSFRAVKPPECGVMVTVRERMTQAPLPGISVILHPYRGLTNEQGIACLNVTKGSFRLYVMGDGHYEIFQKDVEVAGDLRIDAELDTLLPDVDEI